MISPTPSSANIPGVRRTSEALRSDASLRDASLRDASLRDASLRVTTAAESAARDQSAISAGTPSFTLMLQAGTRAAEVILRDLSDRLSAGVAIYAGSGNNGGDAYIVAAQLARMGVAVRLRVVAEPRTDDARRAAALAQSLRPRVSASTPEPWSPPTGREQLVVDGVLGTGHRGALRESAQQAAREMQHARTRGATVVSLDIPTGLDATTGETADDAVVADTTITFGTVKRGALMVRGHVGRLVLVDIGLGAHAAGNDDAWRLHSAHDMSARIPPIVWNAHKRTRGFLLVVGGAQGMAGAVVLASRAALASGAGLVRAIVDDPSGVVLQQSIPQAITTPWLMLADVAPEWPDALVIGPGLGRSAASRTVLIEALQRHPNVPVLLDADALTLLASPSFDAPQFRDLCGPTRAVVCTPHLGEFARLSGVSAASDWDTREAALRDLAQRMNAVVLLKGTPTLIASADGRVVHAAPYGSAVLATGGSGDMLAGIIGALLAQGMTPDDAACLGAAVHGQSAEYVATQIGVRGSSLDDVLHALPSVWQAVSRVRPLSPGVLMELPSLRVNS